jgi:hypothetical protein
MPTLATEIWNKLEHVVIEARDVAEAGARAALEALAVHEPKFYPHMSTESQTLRNHLRARARQLGDRQDASGRLAIDHLAAECAYEQWHRILFARFLAENGLLIEPQENMAISLAEAEELAKEDGIDVWVFASRCAQKMLPQIFRPDDRLLQVPLAAEHMLKLEELLASLPQALFAASDALGWVYQFWQSKKKDGINRSEVKIGADEIAAVTQLFTEPYMVEFLLHNTLGAWWAEKRLSHDDAKSATSEEDLRRQLALPNVGWEYLRFVRGPDGEAGSWRPAAGTFEDWPKTAADLKVLDPCCGSGHFLVAALHQLVPIRMAEEGLSPAQAVDAVLRDNLHGLEIDERCCQIAAFALAFAAWTYPDAGGYRSLPNGHLACAGIGPQSAQEQWAKLAEQSGMPVATDERMRITNGLLTLHRLFSQAPILGSLIDPSKLPSDVFTADYETIQPYLTSIRLAERADDDTRERAIAATGMLKAADLLAGRYTLVATNVPFLTAIRFSDTLKQYVETVFGPAKANLATAMSSRLRQFADACGHAAYVCPQSWMYLKGSTGFRDNLLRTKAPQLIAKLGERSFRSGDANGEPVSLCVMGGGRRPRSSFFMLDATTGPTPEAKGSMLRCHELACLDMETQLTNPMSAIIPDAHQARATLGDVATAFCGVSTSDSPRFIRKYWEVVSLGGPSDDWEFHHSTTAETKLFAGMENAIYWQKEAGDLAALAESVKHLNHNAQNWRRGKPNWNKRGVVVSQMGRLEGALYCGNIYDNNCTAIVPNDESLVPALWSYCRSGTLSERVRTINQKRSVEVGTFLAAGFNREEWMRVAAEEYPDGLPEPESDDPTQWLFHGRPEESTAPLQGAVVRLVGYRWPAELDDQMRLSKRARALVERCEELARFADEDGIVCMPSVRGEEPAAERLEALLAVAGVKSARTRELASGSDLDDWLRSSFFEEHCKLFKDRPFVWHIWDGRKRDGFHALVNYHKLCEGEGKGRKLLESLTYSYLGEWITRQKDGVKRGEGGAEDRLVASLELQKRLQAILAGEPPFDLFVRWKPLAEQPFGWEPDTNDGVRVNIRPFLASDLPAGRSGAGILRWKPNIKWDKDRGKEPERPKAEYPWFWNWDEKTADFMGAGKEPDGNRHNGCHYTTRVKVAARTARGGKP